MQIAGLVLAAGASLRMGTPKALLPWGGGCFVDAVVSILKHAGASLVVVVTRAELYPAVVERVGGRACVLVNPEPDRGMNSSIRVGVDYLVSGRNPFAGVALHPVDQPGILVSTARCLLEAFHSQPDRLVLPVAISGLHQDGGGVYRRIAVTGNTQEGAVSTSRRGHPVIFPRDLWHDLYNENPAGARTVVWQNAHRLLEVPVEDRGAFTNVNTPDDFRRLTCLEALL